MEEPHRYQAFAFPDGSTDGGRPQSHGLESLGEFTMLDRFLPNSSEMPHL